MFKRYDELTFTDDFMFCHILVENEDLCKELTEMVTGRKVREIIKMHTQKPIQITVDGKGVRFDVYFEDDANRIYDIEMQTTNTGNLKTRVRYYQAMIDMDHVNRGEKYETLKETCVIFICMFDLFGKGLHKYTFMDTCKEIPELELGDGTEKIFLCAGGDKNDCSEKMKGFLDYISGKKAADDFTERLDEALQDALQKNEWRSSYMRWIDLQEEIKEEGRAEGMIGTLFGLFSKNRISIEEAAEEAHMSIEQIKERFSKMSLA